MFYNLAVSCQAPVPVLPKDPRSHNCLQGNSRVLRLTALIVELALIGLAIYAGVTSGGISSTMVQVLVGVAGGVLLLDMVTGVSRALKKTQPVTHRQFVVALRTQQGVSPALSEPKGFLYEIKLQDRTVGYLFGALDGWDVTWGGLSPRVQEAIRSSQAVYMEYNGWQGELPKPTSQWAVSDLAEGKEVHYLADVKLRANQTNLWWQACGSSVQISSEAIHTAWSTGEEEPLRQLAEATCDSLSKNHRASFYTQAFTKPAKDWFEQAICPGLLKARDRQEQVFISVGVLSLFDVQGQGANFGLKSLLTRRGFTLEAVRE